MNSYAKISPRHASEAKAIIDEALPRDEEIWNDVYWVTVRNNIEAAKLTEATTP